MSEQPAEIPLGIETLTSSDELGTGGALESKGTTIMIILVEAIERAVPFSAVIAAIRSVSALIESPI